MIGLRWLVSSPKRFFLGFIVLTGLFGCSGGGVGKGNAPAYLVIYRTGSTTPASTIYAFDCFQEGVSARMFFTDGTSGDFTTRVVWSSSSPGTVAVSNGDQPAPGGGFYKNGTLTPASPGNATIAATYDGIITTSINVIVDDPQSVTIERVIQGNPVVPTNNAFTMGVATTEQLTAIATLNGVQENIASQPGVIWSFMPPNDGTATINSTSGLITGNSPGGPLSATLSFQFCPLMVSTTVTVATIQSISMQAEFGTDPLVVGNTEKINVFADFGNGPDQDISTQATLASSIPTSFLFGTTIGSNIGLSEAPGNVNINAQFPQGGSAIPQANLSVSMINASLETISVTPRTASLYAGSTVTQQYQAFGSYNEGAITQEITRQVTWSVDNTALATISNAKQTAGQVTATSNLTGGSVTITATDTLATIAPVVYAYLTILAP